MIYLFLLFVFSGIDKDLPTVLMEHRKQVLGEEFFRITARRGHLYDDTIECLQLGFDERKHIRVIFFNEPAVDDGGPRREFFMSLLGEVANNGSLFDGPPNRRVVRHNVTALQVTS